MAKSFIDSFLEQVTLSGQVSPPVGIFLLKNWCNYKDTIGIEENVPHNETRRVLRADELPIFLGKPEEREEWEKRNDILLELAVTEPEITAD